MFFDIGLKKISIVGLGMMLTACNGIFDDIYDQPTEEVEAREGQLYVEANNWQQWQYIDLEPLVADKDAQPTVTTMPIPTERSTESHGRSGIYTYWFDVFGQGLGNNHPAETDPFIPTAPQPEPESWTIAVHREVARTHGAEVFRTEYTSMDQLPASSEAFRNVTFTPDEWSETDVWVDQKRLFQGYMGSQGIEINKVLSGWITCHMPPVPPTYSMDDHVYVLRLSNGRYAALQLVNFVSPTGTKCCLTINYKYPY